MSSSSRSFNVPLENGFLFIFAELVSEGTFPFSICICQMFSTIHVYLCCGRPFYKITYPIFTLMMFVFGSCYGRMHRSDHSDKWFYLLPVPYGYFMVNCALIFHGVNGIKFQSTCQPLDMFVMITCISQLSKLLDEDLWSRKTSPYQQTFGATVRRISQLVRIFLDCQSIKSICNCR